MNDEKAAELGTTEPGEYVVGVDPARGPDETVSVPVNPETLVGVDIGAHNQVRPSEQCPYCTSRAVTRAEWREGELSAIQAGLVRKAELQGAWLAECRQCGKRWAVVRATEPTPEPVKVARADGNRKQRRAAASRARHGSGRDAAKAHRRRGA